jgi:transposase
MGMPTMSKVRTFVALDVHVSATVAAVLDAESGELSRRRLSGATGEVIEFVTGLEGPVHATYEAGPTGFALARRLQTAGVDCLVCAPGLVPRGPSDRVKTDQRDAERLVRLLVAGELHRVAVPSIEAESLRDLVRAREDLRGDLMSARHRVGKLLLRHDVRFDGPERNWTQPHLRWLAGVRFEQPGTQAAFDDYRGAVEALIIRRDELERAIAEQLPVSPWAQTARRLMCLRGIDTLTAAGLCAEIGDFDRLSSRAADELSRRRPVRALLRDPTPAGIDHEVRITARPPAAGRGRLALPPATTSQRAAATPAGRRRPEDRRALLEDPTTTPSRLVADGAARQAPHDHRGRRRARARRVLLGALNSRLTPGRHHVGLGGGGHRGPFAPEHP